MLRNLILLCAAAMAALFAAAPLRAGAPPEMVEARLLPGWRMEDGRHMAALRLDLAPGWKTYWRAPGEAGIPPQFDWSRSDNLAGVEVNWPTPHPIRSNGLSSIGYTDRLILPLSLTPDRAGRDITLTARIGIGVCSDICVPVTLDLSQVLPPTGGRPDPQIVAALANRAMTAQEAGVRRVACRFTPIEGGLRLRAEIELRGLGASQTVVVESGNPNLWVAQGETRREAGGRLRAEAEFYHVDGRNGFSVDRSGLRITLLNQRRAVEIKGCPAG